MAGERTIQATYDHADRGPRRDDRPSGVRRRAASFEGESLSTSVCLAALAAATDGVLLINRAGVIIYANPAAEEFFSGRALSGQFFSDVSTIDRRILNRILRELRRARSWRGRLALRSPDREIDVTVKHVIDEATTGENFCVVLHGATGPAARGEQPIVATSSEAALAPIAGPSEPGSKRGARSDLHTALQRVASEIAHDFNNQIAVILNYTFVLLRQMPEGPLKGHVSEMQAAAWRASQVAQAIHRALVTHTLLPSNE